MTKVFDLNDRLNPICLPDNMNQNNVICLTALWKEYYYSMSQVKDMDYVITAKYNETDCEKLFANVDKKICTERSGDKVNKCNVSSFFFYLFQNYQPPFCELSNPLNQYWFQNVG